MLEATKEAYAAGCVLIVHYECGMIGEGEVVPVHAIAVKDPVANRTETFLARSDEAEALASFAMFAKSHEDWCWLHWNMRNAAYGFEHIQKRLSRVCEGESFIIPENRSDLGFVYWQVYGDMPHGERGKLHGLCDANAVTTANALAGIDIQCKVKAGHWAAVEASAVRKVDMIQATWSRMLDGSLRPVESESGPPSTDEVRCDPMSKTKIARRLLNNPVARLREAEGVMARYGLRCEGGGKWTIVVSGRMDARTRKRVLAPLK